MSFYLGWIYKKGQCTKNFFRVSTCFSNIFTQHMFFPETCFASSISEPEFTVCLNKGKSRLCTDLHVIVIIRSPISEWGYDIGLAHAPIEFDSLQLSGGFFQLSFRRIFCPRWRLGLPAMLRTRLFTLRGWSLSAWVQIGAWRWVPLLWRVGPVNRRNEIRNIQWNRFFFSFSSCFLYLWKVKH